MIKFITLILILLIHNLSYSQNMKSLSQTLKSEQHSSKNSKIQEEKEIESVKFNNIKKVLKEDDLEKFKKKKIKKIKVIKNKKIELELDRYRYPSQGEFWSFMTEYWLVKNAQILQWDFSKPDYGIGLAFSHLLQKLGFYNKKINILIVNTPELTHAVLPGNPDEFYFLVSLPFMRTIDLTKVDISLLLLEDFFRGEENYFKKNLNVDSSFIGKNFFKQKFNRKVLDTYLKEYSKIIFKDGYSFQQQYQVSKKMDVILKSYPSLWNDYFKVIKKIDRLIKDNILYKNYNNIYPSPEMQLKWLNPTRKQI